jgi:hypothetical protein
MKTFDGKNYTLKADDSAVHAITIVQAFAHFHQVLPS